jgi:hypothetical protein
MQPINIILGALIWLSATTLPTILGYPLYGVSRIGERSHRPLNGSERLKQVPCHSHNDYWRARPLFSALEVGCIGVEVDVWLSREDLYIGHNSPSLSARHTLKKLYLEPLQELLDKRNPVSQAGDRKGVFDSDPSQTLVLLVDMKTNGRQVWPYLTAQLSDLRAKGYLSHFNGNGVVSRPITVVASGLAPFELITANSTYRDIFYDAPLDKLSGPGPGSRKSDVPKVQEPAPVDSDSMFDFSLEPHLSDEEDGESLQAQDTGQAPYNPTNSYYASVSYERSIGVPWQFRVSKPQEEKIKSQIRAAHLAGLKARYWATPGWPRSLRHHVWEVLAREGVDVLNVDDIKDAARRHGPKRPRPG